MKLVLNNVDLGTLGVLVITGSRTEREPVEAPQRERVTTRVRLDFFESSYADNAALVAEVRAALKQQQTQLLWQDDNGSPYLSRTVAIAGDDEPEDGRSVSGTTHQAVTFSFWYYNHDVVTNCLNATATAGGVNQDMGAVELWEEGYEAKYFDPLRDPRELVQGMISCTGRWQGDTTQPLVTRRTALLALKDKLTAMLVQNAAVSFAYGTFTQSLRVDNFSAKVNQPMNFVEWSLKAHFTLYPNEANYAILTYKVSHKIKPEDGIDHLTIAGSIRATTLALAQKQVALLQGAIVPAGYVQEENDTDAAYGQSASADTGTDLTTLTGDGVTFIDLAFNLEFRDTKTVSCVITPTGGSDINLGTVEKFRKGYNAQLFDEMRDQRKRGGGSVSMSGIVFAPDTMTLAQKQNYLKGQLTAMQGIEQESSATVVYGGVFNQRIRVTEFTPDLDRFQNRIKWSLTGSYTSFPDEANYAMTEFKVGTKEDKQAGTVILSLTGKIGAPTEDEALAALDALRASAVPDGFVLISEDPVASNVAADTDGTAFIELNFTDEWQKASGGITTWSLKISPEDDLKSGWQRVTYSGTVVATAADRTTAYNIAAAQAALLGDDQSDFQIRSTVAENDRLFLTSGGKVWVTVEFSYEYQVKGARVYIEVTSELNRETFGRSTEAVNGFIAAPTLAVAQAAYGTNVRGLAAYAGALILNERTPTLDQQQVQSAVSDGSDAVKQDGIFRFAFTVHRAKASDETSLQYSVESASAIQENKRTSSVKGTIYAADMVTAQAALTTYIGGLGLGKLTNSSQSPRYEQVVADGDAVFLALDFSQTYTAALSFGGLLQTSVSEDVQYAGTRWVIKGIPDGTDIIQNCGTQSGRRTVTAMAMGPTENLCRNYVATAHDNLITGQYEQPPRLNTEFKFLEQVAGVARGAGLNVMVCVVTATYEEILPTLTYAE